MHHPGFATKEPQAPSEARPSRHEIRRSDHHPRNDIISAPGRLQRRLSDKGQGYHRPGPLLLPSICCREDRPSPRVFPAPSSTPRRAKWRRRPSSAISAKGRWCILVWDSDLVSREPPQGWGPEPGRSSMTRPAWPRQLILFSEITCDLCL